MIRIQRILRPSQHALTWKLALPILGLSAVCFAVYAHGEPGQEVHGTLHISGGSEEAYAMVRKAEKGMFLSGDLDDIKLVNKTRQHLKGDFLWFRRGKATYVVQDPALLGKAREAWAPTEPVSKKMDVLSAQMEPHEQKMEALGRQMEAASQRGEPSSKQLELAGEKLEPLARQQDALGKKMEQLSKRMLTGNSDAQREQLGREMEALSAKMEQLGAQMEVISAGMERHGKALEKAHEPMEALGRQMEEAGKPMEALGAQMEVLGKQQELLSKAADRKLRLLIDEAMRDGKAVPTRSITQ